MINRHALRTLNTLPLLGIFSLHVDLLTLSHSDLADCKDYLLFSVHNSLFQFTVICQEKYYGFAIIAKKIKIFPKL